METFRLWLEPDKKVPRFKRLQFEKAEVSVADVLKKGIHPWQGADSHRTLGEKSVSVLNSDEMKPAELAQFNYCGDISCVTRSYYYNSSASPFEETLKRISEYVCFVGGLSYAELLTIAREQLQRDWSHRVAHRLLDRLCPSFDALRRFLKAKDNRVKLSGHADIDSYDLGRILSLADFEGEDGILINEGVPVTNFRSVRFLERVTDDRGLLRLTESIRHFQMEPTGRGQQYCRAALYNCRRDGDAVRFVPELEQTTSKRVAAKEIAGRWRTDNGRYCFTTDISRLAEMVEKGGFEISFPSLDYMDSTEPSTSSAEVAVSKVERFSVGRFLTTNAPGNRLKAVLREHGISMTGRKEQLLEKLAQLSVKLYQENERELDAFFGSHRFLRVNNDRNSDGKNLPVLEGLDVRNMVLTMYIVKHLRGNTILEASHNNDTFDLLSLAGSLMKKEVSLTGSFLRVE